MGATKLSILITLLRIMSKGHKHYAVPTPNSPLYLIEKYHHIKIRRRWLFQCLHDLEQAGLITRKRRYAQISSRRWKQKPSMIIFTLQGADFLWKKSIDGAGKLRKSISEWINRKNHDRRWPLRKDIFNPEASRQGDPAALGEVLKFALPARAGPGG